MSDIILSILGMNKWKKNFPGEMKRVGSQTVFLLAPLAVVELMKILHLLIMSESILDSFKLYTTAFYILPCYQVI